MGVHNKNSLHEAVEQLLTPQQEQGDEIVPEQESPEEETLEAEQEQETELDEEVESSNEVEEETDEEEVGDDSEEDESLDDGEATDDAFYTVKVDGEEYEVNLEELKKGYQLEKSYTKKSQALAEEKKEIESLKQQLTTEREKYLQYTTMLAQEQQAVLEKAKQELASIDKDDDPIGFVRKQLEVQDIEKGLHDKVRNYEAALAEQQKQSQANMAQYLEQQNAILAQELDGWSDPEQAMAIKKGIVEFAKTQGYTDQELESVHSAKDMIVLNKARLYDEMMKKRQVVSQKRTPAKAVAKIKSSAKPSNKTVKAREVKAKKEQFKRSGTVKDAQSLLMDLMSSRKPIKK